MPIPRPTVAGACHKTTRVPGPVLATLQPTRRPRCCRCVRVQSTTAGRRGEEPSSLPLVEDATVLPPPATGSQYAWRSSWAGSASNGSGGGGTGGRWQARTRDWGRGPGSSGLLFYLMYRIRVLLLYGVWVTVLYGAVTGVADLSRKFGSGLAWAATRAAAVTGLAPSSSSSASSSSASSSSASEDGAGPAAAATGCAGGGGEGAAAAGSPEPAASAPLASAAEAQPPLVVQQQQQGQAVAPGGLRDRPAARFFNDWMSVVVPLYLVLLGSVAFFSTM